MRSIKLRPSKPPKQPRDGKLKDARFFLVPDLGKETDSYVRLSVGSWQATLKMADCNRSIEWAFIWDKPESAKRSLRKLKKFRDLINDLYAELERRAKE